MTLEFEWNGKRYTGWSEEKAREKGIPAEVIATALAQARRRLVSAECRRRIYEKASAETQMNMATASAVISGKATSSRSAEEKAVLKSIIDANIKANAKLILALTRVREDVQGLTEKIQRLKKEKAPLQLSKANVRMLLNTIIKLMENNSLALYALTEARIAHHECQRARIRAER